MNSVTFVTQAKYLLELFLILIALFLILAYLVTIPGNKRIDAYLKDDNLLKERKRHKKKFIEVSLIILLIGMVVLLTLNTIEFR